ncbi:MAG: hypothetical protein NPIRA01_31470 [Nitrospirales bacterium]|nr:MAG: hypothetical protein NPIRA01_31470 [Nitrospirales bacterium]
MGEPYGYTLESIEFAGAMTVSVRMRSSMLGKDFIDFLSLIRVADKWRIISKVFPYETQENRGQSTCFTIYNSSPFSAERQNATPVTSSIGLGRDVIHRTIKTRLEIGHNVFKFDVGQDDKKGMIEARIMKARCQARLQFN